MDERARLEAAMAALEAQRSLLGDAVVDAALGSMRERLAQMLGGTAVPGLGGEAAPLPAGPPAAPEQLRRQVSVLFLDVVGSTALAQHLDPEDIHALMDGTLRRCTEVVQAHGGRVLQYAGDNLLAAFGADGAQEDDAERAVHCALALLGEGSVLAERVQREHGHAGCQVRVGIHTGPVLLGGGVEDEGTIRGQAVNIAARMEQTAPVGGLRISHDTWLLVRGLFEVQPQPALAVKGVDEPIVTYLVQGAKARAFRVPSRGIEGERVAMVGRDAELERLRGLLDATARERRLHAATVIGEPGLGKSRLLHELQALLEIHAQRFWLFLARGQAQRRLQPYGVLRDMLAWRLQIADSDSGETARERLVQGLTPWLGEQALAKAQRIGQLIGMDFSSSEHVIGIGPLLLRNLAFAGLVDYLRGLAAGGAATALLIEDLHWADDGTLDFIEHLAGRSADLPLVLVATARPELRSRRADWGRPPGGQLLLELSDLSAEQAGALAAALLARAGSAGRGLQALVVQRSGGNPFFIEELVRMFIDLGVLVSEGPDGEQWRVADERLDPSRVPTTLVGVLQARLDALSPAQRLALQQASIVGPVFWDAALAALDPRAPAEVPALQQRELVQRRDASAFEGTHEEAFHHHLLQQVTYDTVLRPLRRAGHAAAAQWLAERIGDRPAEYLAITAEHYDRAGDAENALRYFDRAATEAAQRFANSAAQEYLQRALAHPAATDPRLRIRLYAKLTSLADVIGQRALQQDSLDARYALAEQLDDDALRATVLVERALLASRRGDDEAAMRLALQALQHEERLGDCEDIVSAHGQVAWSLYCRGDLEGAERHARSGLAHSHPTPDGRIDERKAASLRARGLTMLVIISEARGDLEHCLRLGDEVIELTHRHGMRRERASALVSRSVAWMTLGRYRDALAGFEACAALCAEIGLAMNGAVADFNCAYCWLTLGDTARALICLDRAESTFAAVEEAAMHTRTRWLRGRVAVALGDLDHAEACFNEALAAYESRQAPAWIAQCWARLAGLHLQRGQLERARGAAERVAALLTQDLPLADTDDSEYPAWICQRVWQASGDARAAPQLQALHERLLASAAKIRDAELRHSMLEEVPLSREIVAAWHAAQAAASA